MTDSPSRPRAIRVFLQDSLCCAISLARKFKQEYNDQDERIIAAAEGWVLSIEQALTVTGVYGLCAVDRAEEALYLRIREASYDDDNFKEHLKQKSVVVRLSANSYERALFHQKLGQVELLSLWTYIGSCCDRISAFNLERVPVDENNIGFSQTLAPTAAECNPLWQSAWQKKLTAVSAGNYQSAQLYSLACEYFSGASAYEYLVYLLVVYPAVFSCPENARSALGQAQRDACYAGNCLMAAASVCSMEPGIGDDSDPGHQQVVDGYKRAAHMLAPWGPSPQPQEGRRVAASMEARMKQLGARAPTPTSTTETQVQFAGAMIPDQATSNQQSQDAATIADYLARSQAVDRSLSPVHALMAACWEQAAAQLLRATEAAMASTATGPSLPRTWPGHTRLTIAQLIRRCSEAYASLATGLLADAAGYFLKSSHAVSVEARELWRAAAELLVTLGQRDMDSLATWVSSRKRNASTGTDLSASGPRGEGNAVCALYCLYAAELAEEYGLYAATMPVSPLQTRETWAMTELVKVVAKLTIAVVGRADRWSKVMIWVLLRSVWEAFSLVRVRAEAGPLPPDHLARLGLSLPPEAKGASEWLCNFLLAVIELLDDRPDHSWDWSCDAFSMLWPALRDCTRALQEGDAARAVEVERRRCERLLQALTAGLVGRGYEQGLWRKASEIKVFGMRSDVFEEVLKDGISRAAWAERASTAAIPARLLAYPHGAPEGFPHLDLVNMCTEAEVALTKLSRKFCRTEEAQGFQQRAREPFANAAKFAKGWVGGLFALDTAPQRCAQLTSRALQSGRNFVLAMEASGRGKDVLSELYKRAAEFGYTDMVTVGLTDRDRASDLYVKAADALTRRNKVLQPLWQRAAEAMGALLYFTTSRDIDQLRMALAADYTDQKLAAAEALAAEAEAAAAQIARAAERALAVQRAQATLSALATQAKKAALAAPTAHAPPAPGPRAAPQATLAAALVPSTGAADEIKPSEMVQTGSCKHGQCVAW